MGLIKQTINCRQDSGDKKTKRKSFMHLYLGDMAVKLKEAGRQLSGDKTLKQMRTTPRVLVDSRRKVVLMIRFSRKSLTCMMVSNGSAGFIEKACKKKHNYGTGKKTMLKNICPKTCGNC